MGAHAFLAPSSAGKWGPGACPASSRMEELYPEDEESPEAIEGTAAHVAFSEPLLGRTVTAGTLAPNGHPIDETMISAVEEVHADIRDTMRAHPNCVLRVEERVDMSTSVHPQNWGTPDAYIIDLARKVLFVWDYKYGHRYVDVYHNWQCIDYAIGVLECNDVPMHEWAEWTIYITIAQPRNYHPSGQLREWQFPGAELATFAGMLRAAAIAATDPEAPMVTGEYCLDCTACASCPAAQKAAMRLVDFTMRAQPVDLPPEALSFMLRLMADAEKRIKAMRVSLEETGLGMVRRGVSLPHHRGEYSYGREKWTLPADQVFAYGDNLGIDLRKKSEPITPAQARALKKVDPTLIDMFAEKPRGALTLVPFDQSEIGRFFK